MKISDEALDEFIAIYKKEFGEEVDRKAASEMAFRLLTLYELLAKKLPNEQVSTPKPRDESGETRSKIGFRT